MAKRDCEGLRACLTCGHSIEGLRSYDLFCSSLCHETQVARLPKSRKRQLEQAMRLDATRLLLERPASLQQSRLMALKRAEKRRERARAHDRERYPLRASAIAVRRRQLSPEMLEQLREQERIRAINYYHNNQSYRERKKAQSIAHYRENRAELLAKRVRDKAIIKAVAELGLLDSDDLMESIRPLLNGL